MREAIVAMRVYELAKQHNLTSKDIMKVLEELGIPVETHMSALSEDEVIAIEKKLKSKTPAHPMPQQSAAAIQKTVGRNTSERQGFVNQTSRSGMQKGAFKKEEVVPEVIQIQPLRLHPMLVTEFADQTGKSLGEVIGCLLRQGIVIAKNQMLSEELVERLARAFAIPVQSETLAGATNVEPVKSAENIKKVSKGIATDIVRQPIVVVMGHVDHGKTTLLDTIRKTRVAAKEKGGITQHLGAYEVNINHEKITFLDTPGHAAFSMIRSRGAHIADIAVLVVAADDGVKPQTIEALRVAKDANIPIIVAINKIDRASAAQIETVKRELAQRDLVPEDWGGQTIMVPLVAKTGQGVESLLEMISLQAQMMELGASTKVAAQGFVIESTVERGLGFVATVIVRQGIFHIGDSFICGHTEGKIVALINAQGQRVNEALPATPILIVGFRDLPKAGDEIHCVDALADRVQARPKHDQRMAPASAMNDQEFCIVLKADNGSSLEAVVGALTKGFKGARPIRVLHSGVGLVSERDVTYAAESKAIIYTLHVKWEPRAQDLAQRLKVESHSFNIIYALLDDIALRAQEKKTVEKISKKIGEAIVLKVFDIKKMGIVAGAMIKNGIFTRNGFVKIFRGKQEIGKGAIKSLQRDRKAVKEVHAGYECAFLIDNFSDWHEGDRVECYQESSS
jgi:translation initiation factor IF-2